MPCLGQWSCRGSVWATSQRPYLNRGTGGDHTRVIDGVAVIDIIWQRRALLHLGRRGDRRQGGVLGGRADV